ncbi:MAG: hypothetical protein AB1941_19170 [Gemmatimonadota bacterium]
MEEPIEEESMHELETYTVGPTAADRAGLIPVETPVQAVARLLRETRLQREREAAGLPWDVEA